MLASNSSPALVHISRYEYPEGARLPTHILRGPASNFDCVVLFWCVFFSSDPGEEEEAADSVLLTLHALIHSPSA